jgi:SET domain-containing protein
MTKPPTMLRPEPYHATKLAVRRSPLHRWGVFATAPIAAHEVLEEVPYYCVPKAELAAAEPYSYYLTDDTSIFGGGMAGFYNHSEAPNTDHEIDRVNELMRHYALRDIATGEELTLNYGEENASMFLRKDLPPCQ